MFTGIIEEVGTIQSIPSGAGTLRIGAKKVLQDTKVGDSIAVNGICLTATAIGVDFFTADVMPETINRTSLSKLHAGSKVNLERAMAADGRFGGHIVSGHIDGTGNIRSLKKDENAVLVTIEANRNILRFVVEKGSIAIDGISLTVAKVDDESFTVSVIPHTGEETTLLGKAAGDPVNLETDIVGKYVEKLLKPYAGTEEKTERHGGITEDFLREHGF